MVLLLLIVFRSLQTKNGHFLWPKHKLTGPGYCVFQIPNFVQAHIANVSGKESDKIFSQMWATFLESNHFEWCDPILVMQLNPNDVPKDIPDRDDILSAIRRLQEKGEAWFLSLDPPPNMSEEERSFYQKHDVKNASN